MAKHETTGKTTARTDGSRESLPADGVHGRAALRTLDDVSAAAARLRERNADR